MSSGNPWKRLSSRTVYQNPWIRVREDSVLRPDGQPGIYGVVETRIATGAVAVTDDLQVFLVGQYRYPLDVYSWEIPEGGTEDDEEPLACIQRELREEAGVVASDWSQLGGEVHLSNCISAERGYLFLARGLSRVPCEPDATEELEVRTASLEECVRMVHCGEITDSLSIIGILRAEALLLRGVELNGRP